MAAGVAVGDHGHGTTDTAHSNCSTRETLRLRRDFNDIAGFSTRNQLKAANGKVIAAAMIPKTGGARKPSPPITSICCIGNA